MVLYLVLSLLVCIGIGIFVGHKERDFFIGACTTAGFYLFLGMLGYAALLIGLIEV